MRAYPLLFAYYMCIESAVPETAVNDIAMLPPGTLYAELQATAENEEIWNNSNRILYLASITTLVSQNI